MRKISTFLILLTILISTITSSYAQEPVKPQISSEAGVLVDFDTGEVLYNKNAFEKMYPASTTKVMTALLTLENCDNLDEIVKIDYDLDYIGGSSMYIKKGESFTVRQLLEFMLIRSANDAAVALANHVSGSVDEFKDLMNQRAIQLGCKSTHFNNPNGMPDENHYTSAYDLALIASEAMKSEEFKKIVKTTAVKMAPTEQTPEWRVYKNSNRFLWGKGGYHTINYKGKVVDIKYDLIDGIKTGYTNAAGNCLISSGEQDGFRLISVILKAKGSNVYVDSRSLIDFGFENYHLENYLLKGEKLGENKMFFSKEKNLEYSIDKNIGFVVQNGKTLDSLNITHKLALYEDIKLPLKAGQQVGEIKIYKDGNLSSTEKLVSISDVNPLSLFLMAKVIALKVLKYIAVILFSFFSFCLVVRFINLKILRGKRRKRRKNYKYYS